MISSGTLSEEQTWNRTQFPHQFRPKPWPFVVRLCDVRWLHSCGESWFSWVWVGANDVSCNEPNREWNRDGSGHF